MIAAAAEREQGITIDVAYRYFATARRKFILADAPGHEQYTRTKPFRFPVQLVLRPNLDFRGYAGQIVSGMVRVGDAVAVWPSGRQTRIKRIVTADGDLDMAFAPMSARGSRRRSSGWTSARSTPDAPIC